MDHNVIMYNLITDIIRDTKFIDLYAYYRQIFATDLFNSSHQSFLLDGKYPKSQFL